jgi:hypothetical protein
MLYMGSGPQPKSYRCGDGQRRRGISGETWPCHVSTSEILVLLLTGSRNGGAFGVFSQLLRQVLVILFTISTYLNLSPSSGRYPLTNSLAEIDLRPSGWS